MTAKREIPLPEQYLLEMYYTLEKLADMEGLLYLAESDVHGIGVFARQGFDAGQVVGWITGPRWNECGPITHVLYCTEDWDCPVMCVGPLRFANHSADPNTMVEYWNPVPGQHPIVTVRALRDIAADEELTWYYSDEFQEDISDEGRGGPSSEGLSNTETESARK